MKSIARHCVVLLVLFFAALTYPSFADDQLVLAFQGLFTAPPAIPERVTSAQLIVRGQATESSVVRFSADPTIVPRPPEDTIYQLGAYRDVAFSVAEYLKGSGPQMLSVRSYASTPELRIDPSSIAAPDPKPGDEVVLFLSQGAGLFEGGYVVPDNSGFAFVRDGEARFLTGEILPLAELRALASGQ